MEKELIDTGTIVNAKLSNCCSSSVSAIYGISESNNRLVYITAHGNKNFHHTCNKCKKECTMIEVPTWKLLLVVSNNGIQRKYRRL
ncbi:MAG TPA: hypothetical protein VN026_02850 [Bacteroidia bacterium]|nr:hypothetical protein [Bacteroidia bacterium]